MVCRHLVFKIFLECGATVVRWFFRTCGVRYMRCYGSTKYFYSYGATVGPNIRVYTVFEYFTNYKCRNTANKNKKTTHFTIIICCIL